MMDIHQAAKDLREHLGRPAWLSAIGVGEQDDRPVIVLYLVFKPKRRPAVLDKGWEGFPVVSFDYGTTVPLGA